MDDLTYSLKQLCQHNRDGSFNTQNDRQQMLKQFARQLIEMGFRKMTATSLRAKHVHRLLELWQAENKDVSTIKNRMVQIRWWAEKIGRNGMIPHDNAALGIAERKTVSEESKAKVLTSEHLDRVRDPYIRMSLRLQAAFGLRREECLKFQPAWADRGSFIRLKASWCKGGRAREIPILTETQRQVLDDAHRLVGRGSMIPTHKSYIQQRHAYDGACKSARLSNAHGLRHLYAQQRYAALTGWACPQRGGPQKRQLSPVQRIKDVFARQAISRELGHERLAIVAVYIGR